MNGIDDCGVIEDSHIHTMQFEIYDVDGCYVKKKYLTFVKVNKHQNVDLN